jgi:hypothetical protein
MHQPRSMRGLEELGRVRLSPNFYLRDFLYSEIANFYGIPNIPADPDLAVRAGGELCRVLLEPLQACFGRLAIRSGYRSARVTAFGNAHKHGAGVQANAAYHIWDMRDRSGFMGAAACIVIPWFADRYKDGADWRQLAWWIHDHLPYGHLEFYPRLCAFNIQWSDSPRRRIDSFIRPKGCLTMPGAPDHEADHAHWYSAFPSPAGF